MATHSQNFVEIGMKPGRPVCTSMVVLLVKLIGLVLIVGFLVWFCSLQFYFFRVKVKSRETERERERQIERVWGQGERKTVSQKANQNLLCERTHNLFLFCLCILLTRVFPLYHQVHRSIGKGLFSLNQRSRVRAPGMQLP